MAKSENEYDENICFKGQPTDRNAVQDLTLMMNFFVIAETDL